MDKVPEMYVGKTYKTWNKFAIEYEQFLEHHAHPIFVIEYSCSAKSYNKRTAQAIPKACGYLHVVFGCAHGQRNPDTSKGLRKRVNKLKMNCTAKLNITYTRKLDAFQIKACQLEHVDENGVKVHELNKEQFSWYRQNNCRQKNFLIPRVVRVYSEQENRITPIVTKRKDLAKECTAYEDLADESDSTGDEPRKKIARICKSKEYHKIKGLPVINIFTDKTGKKHVKQSRKIVIINKTSLDKSDLVKILPRKVIMVPRSNLKSLKEAKKHDDRLQITPRKEATVSNTNFTKDPVQSTPSRQISNVNAEIDKEISARGMKCSNVIVTSLRKPYNIVTVNKNHLPIIEKVSETEMSAIVNNKPICDELPNNSDVGGTNVLDCTELETEFVAGEGETMVEQLEQDLVDLTDPLKFEFAETLMPANLNVAETLENPEVTVKSSSPNFTKTKKLLCRSYSEIVEKLINLKVPEEIANEVATKLAKKHAENLTNHKVAENPTHINITVPKNSFAQNPSIPKVSGKVVEKPANPKGGEKAVIGAMQMCRGCLSTLPPLRPLDGELAQLYKKFIDNNPVCDVFPKLLCGNCSDILLQFTAFRERCFSAQRQFFKTYVAGIELTPNDAVKSQMKQNLHRVKLAKPHKESISSDRQIMVKTSVVEKSPNYAEKSKMKRSPHDESISSNRQIMLEISSNDAVKSKMNQNSYPDIHVIPSEQSNRQLMLEISPMNVLEKRPSPNITVSSSRQIVSSNDAVTSEMNQNSDIIVELEELILPKPAQNVQNLSSKIDTPMKLIEDEVNEIKQIINKKAECLSSGQMIRYITAGGRKIVEIRKTNNVRQVTVKSFEKDAEVFSTDSIEIDDGPKSKVSNIIDDSSIIIDDSSISSLEDASEINSTSSVKDGVDHGAKSKVLITNHDDIDDGSSSSSLDDASEMNSSTSSMKDGVDHGAKSKVSHTNHDDIDDGSSSSSFEDDIVMNISRGSIKDGGDDGAKSKVSNIIHDDSSSISSLDDASEMNFSTSSIKEYEINES